MPQAGSSVGAITSPPPGGPPYPPGSQSISPSGGDKGGKPLSDLAQHGKKGLNQLITFLDQAGRTERSGTGGSLKEGQERANNGLRSVRAKREADEAGSSSFVSPLGMYVIRIHIDKEYRKGVHWLETLRLRRVKILQAGYHVSEICAHAPYHPAHIHCRAWKNL